MRNIISALKIADEEVVKALDQILEGFGGEDDNGPRFFMTLLWLNTLGVLSEAVNHARGHHDVKDLDCFLAGLHKATEKTVKMTEQWRKEARANAKTVN